MGSDVLSERLWLPQIRVLGVVVDDLVEPMVRACSMVGHRRCPRCGAACRRVHDRRAKKVRDPDISGRPAMQVSQRRRLVCDGCDWRFIEDHQAFERSLTARLARRMVAHARQYRLFAFCGAAGFGCLAASVCHAQR